MIREEDHRTLHPRRIGGKRRCGQALIEASLLVPAVFFLFLGLTNFGFYVYAFITVGNAARTAAQRTANVAFRNNQGIACEAALKEMRTLPNVTALTACNSLPLQITMGDPNNPGNYKEPTSDTAAARVNVTYQTIRLFPLPFMDGQMIVNRTAVMRLMDSP